MGRRVISDGCHPVEQKNGDFAGASSSGPHSKRRLFITSEEALHRIWYTLRRWQLISRRIVLFSTTTCSSINQR
ncbi:unnamed protein product [Spirodela intermedia]|uniref:Uncharacterized protein n=1 Tax=Spirodela intermedia TaxID=51605 RepID=A0A7I8KBL0_SPIIN|nr:unnamed protein product [Spirodela intermedia]